LFSATLATGEAKTTYRALSWLVLLQGSFFSSLFSSFSSSSPFSSPVVCSLVSLSLLWEKDNRRPELTLFVLTRNFDLAWQQLVVRGIVKSLPYGEVCFNFSFFLLSLFSRSHLLFLSRLLLLSIPPQVGVLAVAMSIIMSFYQHEPTMLKPTYLKLMQFFFGSKN
jgi:hypothetical protein